MTEEKRNLLLKHLYFSLPYHHKALIRATNCTDVVREFTAEDVYSFEKQISRSAKYEYINQYHDIVTEILPILRSIETITNEEKEELYEFCSFDTDFVNKKPRDISWSVYFYQASTNWRMIDWLLSKNFDIFDLLPNGLAINIKDVKE